MSQMIGMNAYQANTNLWYTALNGITSTVKGSKPVKSKKAPTYKYPEFVYAISYVNDEYWKNRLNDAGLGKIPIGFKYMNNSLRHIKKKISIVLPADNPYQIAMLFIQFLKEHGNFYSPQEMEHSKAMELFQVSENHMLADDTWKKVSKTKHKRVLFFKKYVENKYANLTKSIKDQLFTLINTYYDSGALGIKDVEYSNGEITNIYGITANEGGVFFTRNIIIPQTKMVLKPTGKPKIYCHREHWKKYNENFFKICGGTLDNIKTVSQKSPEDADSEESDDELE